MNASPLAHGIAARSFPEIKLHIASTREEREAVFRLIYQSYYDAGLCEANQLKLRFTPYQLLPTTDIFYAKLRGETICTLSLVRDGELGLPMEDMYAGRVQQRRAAGLRLAEVSCLADRRNEPSRFFELFCDLSRLMVQLADRQLVDQLLIAVHPRHAALYMRYMAFKRIGKKRDYSAVNGNPAVPLCLDLNEIRANHPPQWEKFFGESIPSELLESQSISAFDRDHFLCLDERMRELLEPTEELELFTEKGAFGPMEEDTITADEELQLAELCA